MKLKLAYFFILLSAFLLVDTACTNVQVDLTNPELVVQKFLEGQATNNRKVVNALLTDDLQKRFKEQKLYLNEREGIGKGTLVESKTLLAWDEEDKKVYQLNYSVQYKKDNETKKKGFKEAVSLTQQDGKWYIDDYVPDNHNHPLSGWFALAL